MIMFILKGVLRDRSRSLLPFLVIATGVAFTVLLHSWAQGIFSDMVENNARFQTGHLKIMSRAYTLQQEQLPNDLALTGLDTLLSKTRVMFPEMTWTPRIRFGGLLDIPDEHGKTFSQGPVFGMAVDLFSPESKEAAILQLEKSLVRGHLPQHSGEILLSDEFAHQLNVNPGQTATLLSVTMHGSTSMQNFIVTGTLNFGIKAMDRGAMLADFADIQKALDMQNATGEILGFFKNFQYQQTTADQITRRFNKQFLNLQDEYSPSMLTLRNQENMAQLLDLSAIMASIVISIFIFIMFMVLWNAGLMNGLRRYGEIGVRLAIGEEKGHLYRSMIYESLIIGLLGSLFGTLLGLAASYYLQETGINIGGLLKNSSMLIQNVYRARITPTSYIVGFIPGFLATLLGTAVSGIRIYKRQISQLFKELEV